MSHRPDTTPRPQTAPGKASDNFFLPDFCDVRMVFAVVVISELLAIVLTLSPLQSNTNRWNDLSIISLFVQWVGLSSAAVLCLTRPWLARMSETRAATISYFLLLLTTLVITELAFWAGGFIQLDNWQPNFWQPSGWQQDLLLRNLGISAIVSAIVLRYFYIQLQWKKNVRAEAQARLQALQSRIRPHFLFNSLNTIASLTQIDADLRVIDGNLVSLGVGVCLAMDVDSGIAVREDAGFPDGVHTIPIYSGAIGKVLQRC